LKTIITITVIGLIFISVLSGSVLASLKIVSLAPSITEILYALGLEEQIVGVTTYCDYPPRAKEKKIIGDFSNPVLERIVVLNPDIVFTAGIEQQDITLKLKTLGIRVETVQPHDVDELYQAIEYIGKITNALQQSKILIREMKNYIEPIKEKLNTVSVQEKPTVFILLWHDPLLTAGDNSFVSDVVKKAGGVNIAGKLMYFYSRYNLESLIKGSPNYILVCVMEDKIDKSYIEKISDLTGSKVIDDINPDLLLRPGPRIKKGIKILFKKLYYEK